VVTLAVGALHDPASRRWELVRGAATFCTTVTGIIYALFLADVSVGVTDPWINNVIHRIVPAVAIALALLTFGLSKLGGRHRELAARS
jgi:hypothetical protein